MKMKNPLEYGENATLITDSIPSFTSLPFNGTAVGLCVDNTGTSVFISDYYYHEIIRCNGNIPISRIYGNGTAGNASNQLNNPTSIVMDDNQTL